MKTTMTLFIVDDDADDRKLFIDAVKEIDETIECSTANNGQRALERLRDTTQTLPDFIFLDIRMPLLNGKKCLAEIKKDDRLKNIPVIIYTTSKEVSESQELRDMGAFHFISKPRNSEEIYYLISFVLEEHINASKNNL